MSVYLNINLHLPEDLAKIQELQEKIATCHAQAATDYIDKLACPTKEKLKIIDDKIKEYSQKE